MQYDIEIDFAGASGSSDIPDVGNFGFNVVNLATVLTTANPRLLPTSGLFNGASSNLLVETYGYQTMGDAFRMEIWFYFPDVSMTADILLLPGDMRLRNVDGELSFTSFIGAYTETKSVDPETWHRLIVIRASEGGNMRITGILNSQQWFSRVDNSSYISELISIGSDQGVSSFFQGQVALFRYQADTTGLNPAGRDEPPRASVTLSESSTHQVMDGAYIGEAPYLVRSALGPTAPNPSTGPYEEWDLLPDFSVGLDIPRVRVQAKGAPFQYANGMNVDSNNGSPNIWLSWEGGLQSHEWMNYDPHYFLFYRGNKRFGTYDVNKKKGKFSSWIHPAHTDGAMFNNFSRGESNFTTYSVNWRGSEWAVPLQRFSKVDISDTGVGTSDFTPWSYYRSIFPLSFPIGNSTWSNFYAPLGKRARTNGNQISNNLGMKGCLYLKFCIVIRDPLRPGRPIFGPMSESVMIYPRVGDFAEGRYYYAWGASIRS